MPGSWPPNWLHGTPSTVKPLLGVALLEVLQPGVLRGQPALGGDVDDQHGASAQRLEIEGLAVERGDGGVVEGHDPEPTTGRGTLAKDDLAGHKRQPKKLAADKGRGGCCGRVGASSRLGDHRAVLSTGRCRGEY